MKRMASIWAAALVLTLRGAPALAKTFVYVSNAEDGDIDGYEMNAAGTLTPLGKTKAGKLVMPMAVSLDQKHLYAVLPSQSFTVITYGVDAATGALKQEAAAPLADSMAYASVDKTGRFLFTASYGGDKIAVNPIGANGLIELGPSQVIPTGKNAYSIIADQTDRFVYASNLGSSQILQFTFDAREGRLTPNDPPLVSARPGNGPRHLTVSKDGRYLYAVNELTAAVSQFAIDPKTGALSEIDYYPSAPAATNLQPGLVRQAVAANAASGANTKALEDDKTPRIWAADIHITPDGRFMYTTERTNSTISLMSIAPETGKLTYLASYTTEKQPRGIGLDPTGKFLVAAGEKSDRISVYKIDQRTGALTQVGRYPVGEDANWVVFHLGARLD
jgi:6-phosphogluconolactonase